MAAYLEGGLARYQLPTPQRKTRLGPCDRRLGLQVPGYTRVETSDCDSSDNKRRGYNNSSGRNLARRHRTARPRARKLTREKVRSTNDPGPYSDFIRDQEGKREGITGHLEIGSTSGPAPAWSERVLDLLREPTYMFIYPTPYADSDDASKFLTILDYFREWDETLPHQVSFLTSRLICFEADEGLKEKLTTPVVPISGMDTPVEQSFILEIELLMTIGR